MTSTTANSHFTIGELAQELAITTRTIRYYEERGLLSPERTDTGQRIYTRRERGRLKLILRAKSAGFDLEDVHDVLAIYDANPTETGQKEQARKMIPITEHRIAELQTKISELTILKNELSKHLEVFQQMAADL